jgi:predicted nucleotidyltransferase
VSDGDGDAPFKLDAALRAVLEADARIAFALVFGSVARATPHAASDLDVAIGTTASWSASDIGDLVSRLEEATARVVDLVLLDEAGPGLAYRVFRDGRVVAVRDRAALRARWERAVLDYLDFRPVEELFTRRQLELAARGR